MADPQQINDFAKTLQNISWLVGILSPVGTVIWFAAVTNQKIKGIESALKTCANRGNECRHSREESEKDFQTGQRDHEQRISRLEGSQSGGNK